MHVSAKSMLLSVLLMVLIAGCQDNPVKPPGTGPTSGMISDLNGSIANVTLDSAIFSIYVTQPSEQTVNAHIITAFWEESGITWSIFGGGYSPGMMGSFSADIAGWHSMNITTYAQAWLNGTIFNFGLLLEQGFTNATAYFGSEDASVETRPKLKLCYTDGGISHCVTVQRGTLGSVADAFIWEAFPDDNYGASPTLYTGLVDSLVKQTLIRFELSGLFDGDATIGDLVWNDLDMDGIQNEFESGVSDITVHLFNCADSLVAETVTDLGGHYLFDGIDPGEYYVHFVLPDGWTFSPQDQGDNDCIDSDADPATGRAICTTLDSSETDLCWDAGIFMREGEGCTRSKGYWKNHAGFGPQPDVVTPLLPIWLGLPDSGSSLAVTTAQIAYDILGQHVYGEPSNGITKLYAQLLAAKLNITNGASDEDVADVIDEADEFLAIYGWEGWSDLSQEQQQTVLGWKDTLDAYNNGLIGPGPCDEEDDL